MKECADYLWLGIVSTALLWALTEVVVIPVIDNWRRKRQRAWMAKSAEELADYYKAEAEKWG